MKKMKAQVSFEYLFLILISSFIFSLVIMGILGIEETAKIQTQKNKIRQTCQDLEEKLERICYFGGNTQIYFTKKIEIKNNDNSILIFSEKQQICKIKKQCEVSFLDELKDIDIVCLEKEGGIVLKKC